MELVNNSRFRKHDRILHLERTDPKTSLGLFDPKVFEGDNDLHIVMDPTTLMWSFKYTRGVIPQPLKGNFSSFKAAKEHAEAFLASKSIKVVGVKD